MLAERTGCLLQVLQSLDGLKDSLRVCGCLPEICQRVASCEIDRRFDALTFQQVRQVLLRAALVEAPDVVDSALRDVSLLQCPGDDRSDLHFAVHEGEQLLKHRKKRTTQLSRLKRLFSHKREQSAEPTMSCLSAQCSPPRPTR